MWTVVFESKQIELDVKSKIRTGKITPEDCQVVSAWIRKIETDGPDSIRHDKRWGDHALDKEWKGYRSSCFSTSGRIIYSVKRNIIKIEIARITENHNYKRK